jgi:hypothetical protein
MSDAELRLRFLAWRQIVPEDVCRICDGVGRRTYGSTATWRGISLGEVTMTTDVCNACWGSGDRYRVGVDLRRLRDEETYEVAIQALALLDSLGPDEPAKKAADQLRRRIEAE